MHASEIVRVWDDLRRAETQFKPGSPDARARLIHLSTGPDAATRAGLAPFHAAHTAAGSGQLMGVRLLYGAQVLEGMEGLHSLVQAWHGAVCRSFHHRACVVLAFHTIGTPQWTDWSAYDVAPTPANDARLARSVADILREGNPIGPRLALSLVESLAARGRLLATRPNAPFVAPDAIEGSMTASSCAPVHLHEDEAAGVDGIATAGQRIGK